MGADSVSLKLKLFRLHEWITDETIDTITMVRVELGFLKKYVTHCPTAKGLLIMSLCLAWRSICVFFFFPVTSKSRTRTEFIRRKTNPRHITDKSVSYL